MQEHRVDGTIYRFNADLISDIEVFFAENLSVNSTNNLARGTAHTVKHEGHVFILKHYHRGGLVASISKDRYLWSGINSTRAVREFELLKKLRDEDLPVPEPVAARVSRNGFLFYQCDLVTMQIQNTRTLSDILSEQHLSPADWKALGLCIRNFHDKHVYHADLNASNILLDADRNIYLIDFDKGEIRKGGVVWKQEVLARLRRSLYKFKAGHDTFYFADDNWSDLINAYTGHKAS